MLLGNNYQNLRSLYSNQVKHDVCLEANFGSEIHCIRMEGVQTKSHCKLECHETCIAMYAITNMCIYICAWLRPILRIF